MSGRKTVVLVEAWRDPTPQDDETTGKHTGSVWLNHDANTRHVCEDASAGRARWVSADEPVTEEDRRVSEQIEDLGPGTVHTYRQKALGQAREIVEAAFAAVTEFEETQGGIDPDVAKAMLELEVDAALTLLGYRGRPVHANQAIVGCHNSSVDFDTARLRQERDEWMAEAERLERELREINEALDEAGQTPGG